MSASIFGDRFFGRREPAWHGLGIVLDGNYTATQAVEIAGLDYEVATHPLVADVHGTALETGKVAIVREPTTDDPEYRVLGIAGQNYEVLQNYDIAAILDPLSETWPVETVGALGYGEKVFMSLLVGDSDVRGDPVTEYFLLSEGKTGGDSVTIAYTPVRVVCQNTLTLGLSSATVRSAIVHTVGVRKNLKFQVDLLARLRAARSSGLQSLRRMADIVLSPPQVDIILRTVYPDPKQSQKARLAAEIAASPALDPDLDSIVSEGPGRDLLTAVSLQQYMTERAESFRAAAGERYAAFNDEQPSLARTGWALYNAVVELEDYRTGGSSVEASAVFGSRATTKSRAATAVLSLR